MKRKIFEYLKVPVLLCTETYKGYVLYDDGSYCYEENDYDNFKKSTYENEILKSTELAEQIKEIINSNESDLKQVSKELDNLNFIDGYETFLRFGNIKIQGSNILEELPYTEINEQLIKQNPDLEKKEKDLFFVTHLFVQIIDVIGKYDKRPKHIMKDEPVLSLDPRFGASITKKIKTKRKKKVKTFQMQFDDRKLSRIIEETWEQIQKNNEKAKNK